jgi:uncharacterized protein (DUF305 family)
MKSTHYLKLAAAAAVAIAGLVSIAVLGGCSSDSGSSGDAPGTPVRSGETAAPTAGSGGSRSTDHAAMGHGNGGHAMGTSGIEALKALRGREFDIAFLSQMIAHHQAAVVMAEQALKTASKPETKQEAQKVIAAQTKEIAQMTRWLKEWYNAEPSKEQQALVNTDMQAMMSMPITSDQAFFEMMIPHHQGAIDMSELVPDRTERAEVKQLAQQIIRDQKAEIARYHELMGHGAR